MSRSARRLVAVVQLSVLSLSLWLAPSPAAARRTLDMGYRYDQVWTAAVRLVRVDYGFNVTERDQELGFVMFEYLEGTQTFNGSIEVLRTADTLGRERVRVVVVVQGQPEYVERMITDRLERKLRGDFTLNDRSNMLSAVLIGRTTIKELGWIDPSRTNLANEKLMR